MMCPNCKGRGNGDGESCGANCDCGFIDEVTPTIAQQITDNDLSNINQHTNMSDTKTVKRYSHGRFGMRPDAEYGDMVALSRTIDQMEGKA